MQGSWLFLRPRHVMPLSQHHHSPSMLVSQKCFADFMRIWIHLFMPFICASIEALLAAVVLACSRVPSPCRGAQDPPALKLAIHKITTRHLPRYDPFF